MHDSGRETWREWGRSLALADVTPPAVAGGRPRRRLAGAGAAAAAPRRRPGDAARRRAAGAAPCCCWAPRWPAHTSAAAGVLALAAGGSARRGRLTLSALRPARTWRGRTYPRRSTNSRPISVMSTPVRDTCSTGSVASCASGNANTPARAPHVKPAHRGHGSAEQQAGERRERREREGAADEAHHRLAAAEAREERERVADHGGRHAREAPHQPPSARPASPAASPSTPSPRNAGQARRAPSCSSAFQAPGLPSPVRRRSTPWRARDEQRDRDRAEQVAHERLLRRTPSVPVASFHLTRYPRADRARGIVAAWAWTARAAPHARPAVLAPARHRAGGGR